MGRMLGEIVVLVFAVALSIAILSPAVQVAQSGYAITPYDEAILVMGMVFGLMAPIGYFIAKSWWTRALGLMSSAMAAVCVAAASYLFESHQPFEGVLALALLAAMAFGAERVSKYRSDRRRKALDALEAVVMFEISQAVRDYSDGAGFSPNFAPVVSLARQMAQSEAWAAIHEAYSIDDAQMKLDRALAALQYDLGENPSIDAASSAAKLVGAMRSRLSRLDPRHVERNKSQQAFA